MLFHRSINITFFFFFTVLWYLTNALRKCAQSRWDKLSKLPKIWDMVVTFHVCTVLGKTRMKSIMSSLFHEAGESWDIGITELSKSWPCECWGWSTEGKNLAQDHQFCLVETYLRCGPKGFLAPQPKGHLSHYGHGSAFPRFSSCFRAVYGGEMVQERNHIWIHWKQDCAQHLTSKVSSLNTENIS